MNAKRPKYPIGIQSFSKLREERYLYIDKTSLVYDLAQEYNYVFLSRPRRFGKSLLTSTLQCYFEGRQDLFDGLQISALESAWIPYPVVHFSMGGCTYTDSSVLDSRLNLLLSGLEDKYGRNISETDPGSRLTGVLKRMYKAAGRRVVVLIDEYDKPMLDVLYEQERHAEMLDKLRGFYSALKEADEYLRFVLLTGITKFGKVSVFSGLNNITDISLSPRFNALCGITEGEIRDTLGDCVEAYAEANRMNTDDVMRILKENYDGYHFCDGGEDIYNPFSVLTALQQKRISDYWFETGTPTYLLKMLQHNQYILAGLEHAARTESRLTNPDNIRTDIVPLLYQSGYLTIKGRDSLTDEYLLGFPNREVSKGFWDAVADIVFGHRDAEEAYSLNRMVRSLATGDPETFMIIVRGLMAATASGHESNKEIHFQNMMAIIAQMLGFKVVTEYRSARGIADMEVFTPQYVYIFEFKVDESAQSALAQIRERGYADPYASDPRCKYLIGVEFSSRERTLADWIVERIG